MRGTDVQPDINEQNSWEWAVAFAKLGRGARCWQIDRWTAEVVTAMRADGIRPLLLKGPGTARWLYPDPADRAYRDVDLIVSPSQLAGAQLVLRRIGYEELVYPTWVEPHARCWVRPADGAQVDLHRTLHCLEGAPGEDVWEAVTTGAEELLVGGVSVEIPGPAARALHLLLHLAPNEDPTSQASEDLRQAFNQVDHQVWQSAATLARRLGVEGDMGQRLRDTSEGADLARELGLPLEGSLESSLMFAIGRSDVSPRLFALWCLSSKTTVRAKVGWILQRQFPPRRFMEEAYPPARSGRVGLAASYLQRAAESGSRLPAAVVQWRRFRRHFERTSRVSG